MKLKLNAYLDKEDFWKIKIWGIFDLTVFNKNQCVTTDKIPQFERRRKNEFQAESTHVTTYLTLGSLIIFSKY